MKAPRVLTPATQSTPRAEPTTPAPLRGSMVRWVFLDRDGTINVEPEPGEYIEHPDALKLLPGAAEGVKMLNDAGIWTGVVTNQRGVALGRMSMQDLDAVHERLEYLLGLQGAFVGGIYACPHGIDECDCRKPRPGLLLRARRDHPSLDFAQSAIVGDSSSDVQAGRALGVRTVLISAGVEDAAAGCADHVASDLASAAALLIAGNESPYARS